MKQEFIELFLNGITPLTFLFTFLCFLAGFLVFHFFTVKKAVEVNPETPRKFSWGYWWRDNGESIIKFIIIAYLIIRFTPEVMTLAGVGDVFAQYSGTPFAFVVLGFGYERINKALRKAAAPKE